MPFIKDVNIKKNLWNAFLYFGSSIIQLILGVFTYPIFAKHLSEEDFAIMGYFASISAFFLPLFTLCFNFYYLMRFFRQTEEENEDSFINILIFLSIFNSLLILLSYASIYLYFYFAKISLPFYPFALIIIISLFFDVYRTFLLIDFRVKKKACNYFFLSLIYIVISLALGLVFVVGFHTGAKGRLSGTLLAQFFIALIIIAYLRKKIKFNINFKQIKQAFKYSWPIILGAYAYYPIMNMDKIFLERLNNINEFGLFNIGCTFGGYLLVMATALYQAFEPDWFKYVTKKNKSKFIKSSLFFTAIITFCLLIFLLFSKDIVYFLTAGRYTKAYIYANLHAVSVLFLSISMILNSLILAKQKSNYILYINIIVGILSIFIYKYFILNWSFQGANYARIVIFIILIFVQLFFLRYANILSQLKFVLKKNK